MSNWRERLKELNRYNKIDLEEEVEKEMEIEEDRVCMTNDSGSMISIYENGSIDIKSSPMTGISITQDDGTVRISGKKLALAFEEIDMYTLPFKWRHNKFTINTLPVYAPGMGMLLPDAPMNIAQGFSNIINKYSKIQRG